MALSPAVLVGLSLIGCGFSEGREAPPRPPRGCSSAVEPPYRALCDLEAAWGVVLEAVACGGVAAALALALLLLARLRTVTEPARRSGAAPLLLLLAATVGLFALSLAFLVRRSEALCTARRGLWGALFALCFSCLLAQGVRLRRLARGRGSPSGGSLAGLAVGLAAVQGAMAAEWLLLTVGREGHAACDYLPLDFALVSSYALGLLLAATALSLGVVLCGGGAEEEAQRKRWRCNGLWLFLSCLASLLLWAAWLGFYLYADAMATHDDRGPDWDEPALAITLVTEGWALLLFHAIPEAYLCLRPAPQPAATQDYYDMSHQPPPSHLRQPIYEENLTPSHQPPYTDNQTYSIQEHSAALRSGGYNSGHVGVRPLPFHSHVYQPTEMALLMNGGSIPTAPQNYTGRQLW